MTEKITNAEMFEGVLRRVPGTANGRMKGRFTAEYKDLIKIYYLTEGEKSCNKTSQYFGEAYATIKDIVMPGYKKTHKHKVRQTHNVPASQTLWPGIPAPSQNGLSDVKKTVLSAIDKKIDALKAQRDVILGLDI